ncbi:hypothetical protein HYC85_017006 [Camellia sinensis]|uniref:BHLH domain-containing protein n=1 Tax=Camellia sinensis TaxID=4442 RepID=A0A7J7H4X4_CAMSI|nr:hypothetical protein HYC85_017006 [Camellia sinensis]
MPFSEFYGMASGKLESAQQKTTTCLTDLSHVPHNEFVELVWENGQIMMQGQSSGARRSSTTNNLQSQTPKLQDKDLVKMDSVSNYFTTESPSGEKGLGQDDDTENQTSIPSLRSEVSGIISNTSCNNKRDAIIVQSNLSRRPNTSSSFMNFPHFSRPSTLVRANLQTIDAITSPGTSNVEPMGGKNKGNDPCSGYFAESALFDFSSGLRKEMGTHSQPNLDSEPVMAKRLEESRTAEQSNPVCREDAAKNVELPNQVRGEKTTEPVVASSSACSGNSAERASNETHNLKRKCSENDDSEGRSEDKLMQDVEEESVGVRKAAPARGGTTSKRGRAAEVHNLSERRRRDRINEKMRALQELIPNCNKVDKASMLDEAIEYLKTLQLQVQIMSMGTGLYMPPMMLPTGMQHVHAAQMACFSPMAVGMGMRMGFGMGMLDMNGGSPACSMIQVPPTQGTLFSTPRPPSYSGPTNSQGMAGSNLHIFGHPSQGFSMSAPRGQLAPLSGGPRPPINSAMGSECQCGRS